MHIKNVKVYIVNYFFIFAQVYMYRILITASLVSCLYFEHGDQFVGYILKSKRTKQLQEYLIPKKNKKRFAFMF